MSSKNISPTTTSNVSLVDIKPNQSAIIDSVPDEPLFPPLGLRPGKEVTLHCRHPLNGPLVVDVEGRRVAIGRQIAHQIAVVQEEVSPAWVCRQVGSNH